MKIGAMAAAFAGQGLDKALEYLVEVGIEAIEITTGNYPGDDLCNPAEMLKDKVFDLCRHWCFSAEVALNRV